jgi:hypothetical protein
MDPQQVDITEYSFDQFIDFLFSREITNPDLDLAKPEPWYWHTEVTFDPNEVCEFYIQLFRKPEFLSERFSKLQLDAAFWSIQVENLDCSVHGIIFNTDLPQAVRIRCIESMFDLFQKLFASEPLDAAVFMWWDSLCYDWHCDNRNRDRGGDDLRLQDIFFLTLSRILFIDSETCQRSALHGLGHLHHPDTKQLVDRYLQEKTGLNEDLRTYAIAAAEFKIQ